VLAGAWAALQPLIAEEPGLPPTRPFHLGFTRWPADLTAEGVQQAQDFAHAHGDIVSVMFIGGIPWPEALDGQPFSRDVQANLAYRPPAGTKLFLSISPLDRDRKNLAPYWGEKDNQPLPGPWGGRALNSPEVRQAYLNFVTRAVDAMQPDYLAIGIESNVLLSHSREKWNQLKELHRATYGAVKARRPSLPVCFTTEVLHYKKLASDARSSDQENEVADLMRHSDLFLSGKARPSECAISSSATSVRTPAADFPVRVAAGTRHDRAHVPGSGRRRRVSNDRRATPPHQAGRRFPYRWPCGQPS
jgi:hypothetical protein